MSFLSSRSKKCLTAVVKLLIVVLIVWFVRDTLLNAWQQVGAQTWHWRPLWLLAAGVLYLLALLPAGLFWRHLLKVFGQKPPLAKSLRAYYIGHLGKYVPGKALVVLLRTGLVRGQGVDTALAAASVFYETLTMMVVGAFLAAGALALRFREEKWFLWLAIALMIVAGLPIIPQCFRLLVRLARLEKFNPAADAELSRLGFGTLLVGLGAMFLAWLLMGASLWAAFRSMGLEGLGLLEYAPEYVAAVSLSVVAGFLSMIPAGLVARDLILVQLLVRLFSINDVNAAVAGALLRLIWLLSEMIISGILYFTGR